MRIVVDGYWWHRGPHSNRMVLLEVVTHWIEFFPDDELILVVPRQTRLRDPYPYPPGVTIVTSQLGFHPAINAIELPLIRRVRRAHAILTFNFSALSRRSVCFIHDVLPQTNPEWFTPVERAYCHIIPIIARWPTAVVTTSVSERNRIATNNPRLRRVIPCGLAISSALRDAEPHPSDHLLVSRRFIVSVGRFNVRKNIHTTIEALLHSGLLRPEFPLVLVGESSGATADISGYAEAIENGSVTVIERMTEGQLKWLYMNCRMFVCMSLDEGFGLPVVEAALFGAPVLASDIPVFHETVGGHAQFVHPTDIDAIAKAAQQIASSADGTPQYVEQHSWRSICEDIRSELARIPT